MACAVGAIHFIRNNTGAISGIDAFHLNAGHSWFGAATEQLLRRWAPSPAP